MRSKTRELGGISRAIGNFGRLSVYLLQRACLASKYLFTYSYLNDRYYDFIRPTYAR